MHHPPLERALETVLRLMSEIAPEIPVFFVGTKKDEYLILKSGMSQTQVGALEAGKGQLDEQDIQTRLVKSKEALWKTTLKEECPNIVNKLNIQFTCVSQCKLLDFMRRCSSS